MTLDYFYGQSGELFSYFRIPKALFQDHRFRQLSTDARTLYGILLDRMSLSTKNGWLDEQGRVYIIYTVREVQESLCCAEHKAVKLFRELEQADLIERKRRGLGRPSLIYVKNFSSGLPKAQIQNCANSNSCAAESAVQVRPKSQSNKTDKNKTERNHPFLPDETDRLTQREQLEDPSMACANIATQMTFLGQGASNMAWNDVMMQAGAPTPLHIWDFTIARIPMLTIAILYMTFVGYKLMPDIPNEQFSDAAHTASESEKLSPFKRKLAVLIVLVSIAMMLLENVIGVKMYLTSCIGAAALVLTGVLTEKEALNSIHQPTIFLFAGVLALSDAIQTTGAGDVVADWMIRLLGDTTNPYIIMLVFFLVPFILTQVMSNLATLTIFIPLVTSACIRMGVDPRAAVVGVITASCVSIMTPMAAPCQIMIIEPGGYTLKDYLKCGTPLALILIVVSVFFLPTLYPFA